MYSTDFIMQIFIINTNGQIWHIFLFCVLYLCIPTPRQRALCLFVKGRMVTREEISPKNKNESSQGKFRQGDMHRTSTLPPDIKPPPSTNTCILSNAKHKVLKKIKVGILRWL